MRLCHIGIVFVQKIIVLGVTAETDAHQRVIESSAVSREMKRSTLKGDFGNFYRRNWREVTYFLDDGSVSSFAPLSGSLTLAFRSELIFEFEEALLDHRLAECP